MKSENEWPSNKYPYLLHYLIMIDVYSLIYGDNKNVQDFVCIS